MQRDKNQSNRSGRRSVLKRFGIGAASLSLPAGSAMADPGKGKEKNERTEGIRASASMTVGPDASGMSDSERADFLDRMSRKYGEEAAASITPGDGVSTQGQQPGVEPGSLVWDDDEHLEVENGIGDVLIESDNYAALYETDVYKDGGTEQYYFYWLWSSAQSINHGYVEGNIKDFWNHINLQNDADVTVYDPGGDITRNGTEVTVGASVSGEDPSGSLGASAGIEGTFVLSQDTVGPYPTKTSQSTDEFAVRWEGNYEGTQEINGTLVERRSVSDYRNFKWTVALDGDGV